MCDVSLVHLLIVSSLFCTATSLRVSSRHPQLPSPAHMPYLVGNANCASTCAMFSTLMFERHNTKTAIFGGKPGLPMEYKGMAGNQVLEWADLDNEIKTANLKDVS